MINSLFPVKNPNLHKFIIIMLAVFTFFLIGLALILPLQPAGLPLPDWQADLNGTLTNWKAPKFSMIHPGITELTLRTTFPKVNADTLVIPHISGNSINVLLNHKPIYQLGNPSAPTSNLWNSVTVVQLPEPLLAQNELEIHISSVSTAVGLNAVPYLTNFSADAAHIWLLTWIDYDFLQAAAGMAFILGLILIILSFLRRKLGGTEFYTGLTLLFSVIFYQDDLFRLTSGDLSTFLWAKKIFLISGFLLTLSLFLGLEQYISKRKKINYLWIGLTLLAAIATLVVPDLYALSIVSQYTSIIIAVNLLAVVVLILNHSQKPAWLLYPATLFILSVLQMVLFIPFQLSWPLEAPYVIALTTIMIGVHLVLDFNHVFNENLQLHYTNNIDPLTGVMNRRVLINLNPSIYNFVVLIDLDRFKELNDTLGHPFGDQVLLEFTRITRNNLRQNDLIVRWGGDEFLLVLSDIPKTINGFHLVESIVQRIAVQYGFFHSELNLTFSFGISMVENSLEKSLEEADNRMYKMKMRHKLPQFLPVE